MPTLDSFGLFEQEGVGRDVGSYYKQFHLTARGNALAARLIATALAANNE